MKNLILIDYLNETIVFLSFHSKGILINLILDFFKINNFVTFMINSKFHFF